MKKRIKKRRVIRYEVLHNGSQIALCKTEDQAIQIRVNYVLKNTCYFGSVTIEKRVFFVPAKRFKIHLN